MATQHGYWYQISAPMSTSLNTSTTYDILDGKIITMSGGAGNTPPTTFDGANVTDAKYFYSSGTTGHSYATLSDGTTFGHQGNSGGVDVGTGRLDGNYIEVTRSDGTVEHWMNFNSQVSYYSLMNKLNTYQTNQLALGADADDLQMAQFTLDPSTFTNNKTAWANTGTSTVGGEIVPVVGPGAPPDGVVDGEETGEVMGVGYDDALGATDGGGDMITNGDDSIEGNGGDDTIFAGDGNDTIDGGADNDSIMGGAGDDSILGGVGNDTIDGGADDDLLTGGQGDDDFVYTAGSGADTISDFGNETGSIDDGDQENNDFVDLSSFYNATTFAAVNTAGGSFGNELGMLRADAADGKIDGIIGGTDYSTQIGDIELTIQNGGSAVSGSDLTFDNTNVICFVRNTRIATACGEIPVEHLEVGDRVITRDNGFKTIRWIGSTTRKAEGTLAPIMFREGTVGNHRDLLVSPNHRMLVGSHEAELYIGEYETLVPAKFMVDGKGVLKVEGGTVEYFHILFDSHEIILSEGSWTESFHIGQVGWGSLCEYSRTEILELFPELNKGFLDVDIATARQVLDRREAALVMRGMNHAK